MSFCEFHPRYKSKLLGDPNLTTAKLEAELNEGLAYRNLKKKAKDNKTIPPKKSPLDLPFKICREKRRNKKRKKLILESDREKQKEKLETAQKTISLLERSVLSQRKYMDCLAVPRKYYVEPPLKTKKCPCDIEPCPPRVVQLALPNKHRVFANWKDNYTTLPTEMILRLEEILHTDKSLDPRDARYYYKRLDRLKRKKRRAKRRLRKKKIEEKKRGDRKWLDDQIEKNVKVIMDFVKDQPIFLLNYKQLLLSEGILTQLDKKGVLQKPDRNTKSPYKRTLVEVSDKFALWMDTLIRFVDIQAIDSVEDIPPLTLSTLTEEGTEEGESEEESSEEEDYYRDTDVQEDMEDGEDGDYIEEIMMAPGLRPSGSEPKSLKKGRPTPRPMGKPKPDMKFLKSQLGEDQEEGLDLFDLESIDEDLLEKLIKILSKCSEEFLEQPIGPDRYPGVRYIDVLNKLIELKKGILKQGPQKSFLEQLMVDWAIQNEPDEVDDKLKRKIHEVAGLIDDFMKFMDTTGEGFDDGFETEGEGEGLTSTLGEGEGEGATSILGEGADLDIGEGQGEGEAEGEAEDEGEGEGQGLVIGEAETEPTMIIDGTADVSVQEGRETVDTGVDKIEDMDLFGDEGEGAYEISELEKDEGEALALEEMEGIEEIMKEEMETFVDLGEGPEIMLEAEGEFPTEILYEAEGEAVPCGEQLIKGHKPPKTLEHAPGTICCLSLKMWAVWLMEITQNAHSWTKWVQYIIQRVREFASIVRGDVKLPDGKTQVLYKSEWRKFAKETEANIVTWRAYSQHVQDLTGSIIDNFHDKKVDCCPKCLQDYMIKDVTVAHKTIQALTEAMNCACYWQRTLNGLVERAGTLASLTEEIKKTEEVSSESSESIELEEMIPCVCKKRVVIKVPEEKESDESEYEIEEVDVCTTDIRGSIVTERSSTSRRGSHQSRSSDRGSKGSRRGSQRKSSDKGSLRSYDRDSRRRTSETSSQRRYSETSSKRRYSDRGSQHTTSDVAAVTPGPRYCGPGAPQAGTSATPRVCGPGANKIPCGKGQSQQQAGPKFSGPGPSYKSCGPR